MSRCALSALAIAIWSLIGSVAIARTWTDSSGKHQVEGDFVSLDSGIVTIKKADGNAVQIPFDQLSDKDRQEVDHRKDKHAANPFVAVPLEKAIAPDVSEEKAKTTGEYLDELMTRIYSDAAEADKQDTSIKRGEAWNKAKKAFFGEVAKKTLDFRFPIRDVRKEGRLYRLSLELPVGDDAHGELLQSYVISLSDAQAHGTKPGDLLVLHGKATLLDRSAANNEPREIVRVRAFSAGPETWWIALERPSAKIQSKDKPDAQK
jgi:SLA1 homology domain 1, SHD1